jgi:hypothetical protein
MPGSPAGGGWDGPAGMPLGPMGAAFHMALSPAIAGVAGGVSPLTCGPGMDLSAGAHGRANELCTFALQCYRSVHLSWRVSDGVHLPAAVAHVSDGVKGSSAAGSLGVARRLCLPCYSDSVFFRADTRKQCADTREVERQGHKNHNTTWPGSTAHQAGPQACTSQGGGHA